MKTIIHINQHHIKSNRKNGTLLPVITCKSYKDNRYGHTAEILGNDGEVVATIVYRPNNPLSCGAHVWIETNNLVRTHEYTPMVALLKQGMEAL